MERNIDIIELLSELEDIIDNSFEIPLIRKTLINKDEVMEVIKEISLRIPEEMRVAKAVSEDRNRILDDAQKQADLILKGAEEKIVSLIDEHEITKRANAKADEIITAAQTSGREIKVGAWQYADDVLKKAELGLRDVNAQASASLTKLTDALRNTRAEIQNGKR